MNPQPALTSGASIADGVNGMLNVFIDPPVTARNVPAKLSWLWPVLIQLVVFGVVAYLMMPYSLQLMDAALAQRSVPPEQMEKSRAMMHAITQITTPLTPVIIIAFTALYAALIKVAYAMLAVRAKFRDLFALIACCMLIPMLQYVASYFVIRAKNEPMESAEQMTPPFGLDILFPHLHGPAFAFLNFFSLFQVWFIIVLVIGLAALTRTSKVTALMASTPAWVLPLILRLLGSMFQRSPAS